MVDNLYSYDYKYFIFLSHITSTIWLLFPITNNWTQWIVGRHACE